MKGLITRRYFEEKCKRLGLRVYTNPEKIWMEPYTRNRIAEQEFKKAGDTRLLAALEDDAFSS